MKRRRYLIDDSSYPVFITTTIVDWIPVFSISKIAIGSLKLFESIRSDMNATVNGFVLMTNHFHAIIQTQKKGDISDLLRKWKSLSSKLIIETCNSQKPEWIRVFKESAEINKKTDKQHYQIWLPRFDDYAIRTEKDFLIKLNYIHGNSLKHGLAEDCDEYPYSSFKDYHDSSNGHITVQCVQGKP